MRFFNLSRMAILGLLLIPIASYAVLFADEPTGVEQEMVFAVLPSQALSIGSFSQDEGEETVGLATVQMPEPTFGDLQRGYVEMREAVELDIVSNIPWRVTVSTGDANMGTSHDGSVTKPVSDFQVRGEDGYQAVSNEDETILQGRSGLFKIELDYRLMLDPDEHKDGDYTLTLTYTIAGQ